MTDTLRFAAAAAALWAAVALSFQAAGAARNRRREYSVGSGSRWRGIVYSFTGAMLPWRKETVSLHRGEFLTGIMLHIGVAWALIGMLTLVASPDAGRALMRPGLPVFALSFCSALVLMIRRMRSPLLRSFSTPDDYAAVAITALFLLAAALNALKPEAAAWFLAAGLLLLLYMPLGKLRHAVFFFLSRGNYGLRLGHRGVYPPQPSRMRKASPGEM